MPIETVSDELVADAILASLPVAPAVVSVATLCHDFGFKKHIELTSAIREHYPQIVINVSNIGHGRGIGIARESATEARRIGAAYMETLRETA